MATFSDPTTQWSGTYTTDAGGTNPPPGGIVLGQVQHDGHNFAQNMRVLGVRLKIEQVTVASGSITTTNRYLPLSDPPFMVGPINILAASGIAPPGGTAASLREADNLMEFDQYFKDASTGNYVGYGLRTDYTLPNSWFTTNLPNCDTREIWISPRYLFSRYGLNPMHEPGGVLNAARCHPTIQFEMRPDSSVDHTRDYYRIASIRFDWRIHLYIDRWYTAPGALPQLGNQAGLFRDYEYVFYPTAAFSRNAHVAFQNVEKPLVYEVATQGIEQGLVALDARTTPSPPSSPHSGWDNMHWWGARGAGNPIISAPGAFHAAHVHWRWGGAGATFTRRTHTQFDSSGVPTAVNSHPWGGTSTRVLVDPMIWIQTIKIAVAKNDAALDPGRGAQLQNLMTEDWQTLFTSLRATPDALTSGNGDDIVFWYSSEVFMRTTLPGLVTGMWPFTSQGSPITYTLPARSNGSFGGSVFMHGIFFGHNAEAGGFGTGDTHEDYFPVAQSSIPRAWRRTA